MQAEVEGERDGGKTCKECNIVRRVELQSKEVEVDCPEIHRRSNAQPHSSDLGVAERRVTISDWSSLMLLRHLHDALKNISSLFYNPLENSTGYDRTIGLIM